MKSILAWFWRNVSFMDDQQY